MPALPDSVVAQLFVAAHTHHAWQDRPVDDATLHALYDTFKWGPTAVNGCPARIVFVRSPEQKAVLLACMNPSNVDKTRAAPVTALLAYDLRFYDQLPTLYPQVDARAWYADDPAKAEAVARFNAALQGGYFIVAARALGLDCGPMAGFDADRINAAFFASGSAKVLFACNLGYGDPAAVRPRNPRLPFDVACALV